MVCLIIEQRNSLVTCYNSYSIILIVLLVKLTGVKYCCDACKHCILLDKVNVLKNECEWSCSQGMFQLFTNGVFMKIPVRIKCRDLVKKIAIYRNRLAVRALTLPFSPPPLPPRSPSPSSPLLKLYPSFLLLLLLVIRLSLILIKLPQLASVKKQFSVCLCLSLSLPVSVNFI